MAEKHTCIGDRSDPTHDCWCRRGSNHMAWEHRADLRAARHLEQSSPDSGQD